MAHPPSSYNVREQYSNYATMFWNQSGVNPAKTFAFEGEVEVATMVEVGEVSELVRFLIIPQKCHLLQFEQLKGLRRVHGNHLLHLYTRNLAKKRP